MAKQYRFGDVQLKSRGKHKEYSLNAVTPKLERDAEGNLIPYRAPRFKLNLAEFYNLLRPYVSVRMMEQVRAVVPLALYLLLFQMLILRQLEAHYLIITGGLIAVIVGLMFFMEGLKLGLMPFGTLIGRTLPRKSSLPVVLLITMMLAKVLPSVLQPGSSLAGERHERPNSRQHKRLKNRGRPSKRRLKNKWTISRKPSVFVLKPRIIS